MKRWKFDLFINLLKFDHIHELIYYKILVIWLFALWNSLLYEIVCYMKLFIYDRQWNWAWTNLWTGIILREIKKNLLFMKYII